MFVLLRIISPTLVRSCVGFEGACSRDWMSWTLNRAIYGPPLESWASFIQPRQSGRGESARCLELPLDLRGRPAREGGGSLLPARAADDDAICGAGHVQGWGSEGLGLDVNLALRGRSRRSRSPWGHSAWLRIARTLLLLTGRRDAERP